MMVSNVQCPMSSVQCPLVFTNFSWEGLVDVLCLSSPNFEKKKIQMRVLYRILEVHCLNNVKNPFHTVQSVCPKMKQRFQTITLPKSRVRDGDGGKKITEQILLQLSLLLLNGIFSQLALFQGFQSNNREQRNWAREQETMSNFHSEFEFSLIYYTFTVHEALLVLLKYISKLQIYHQFDNDE